MKKRMDDPSTPDTGTGSLTYLDMGAYEFQNASTPDECDVAAGSSEDCNTSGTLDDCDIAAGTSEDCNSNGTPDECEFEAGCPGLLPADTDCDGSLTGLDIFGFVKTLVEGGYTCQADLDQDGSVSLSDVALFSSALLDS